MPPDAALEIRGISKSYGPTRVLSDIGFVIGRGRIHALVGENGAGKSTLVKIITGIVEADAGEVLLDGTPVRFATPIEARKAGIAAVYQDPKLFAHLDVAENISYGRLSADSPRHDRPACHVCGRHRRARAARHGHRCRMRSWPASRSRKLQFVEIVRALVDRGSRPHPRRADLGTDAGRGRASLRASSARLRDEGKSIVFITHRLEEVEAIADDITVLRDGRHVATRPAREIDRAGLVQMMVGRSMDALFAERGRAKAGDEVLRVEGLGLEGSFVDISFAVRAGEIVGMAGLVGAGRSEIAQALFGMTPPAVGRVTLEGRPVAPRSPRQMLRLGLAYLPEDRDGQGLVMAEIDPRQRHAADRRASRAWASPSARRERQAAEAAIATYQVKATGVDQIVSALSGGNRQKVAFAKWLANDPVALILDEPTHGVDIGSKAQIHEIIADLADRGLAIILISSDLPEVLAMSDRILVVAEGRLVAEIAREDATQERVMAAATGEGRGGSCPLTPIRDEPPRRAAASARSRCACACPASSPFSYCSARSSRR